MEIDERQLQYPTVHGYRIGEEIGGGGFSKLVCPPCTMPTTSSVTNAIEPSLMTVECSEPSMILRVR